jgi:hypothetical protein
MSRGEKPVELALIMRILAVIFGAICIAMGREAISQGYLWNTGYNARIGTETTTSTFSWVIWGILLIAAGIFPWKWVFGHRKHKN